LEFVAQSFALHFGTKIANLVAHFADSDDNSLLACQQAVGLRGLGSDFNAHYTYEIEIRAELLARLQNGPARFARLMAFSKL
jgi:hypothetical protein